MVLYPLLWAALGLAVVRVVQHARWTGDRAASRMPQVSERWARAVHATYASRGLVRSSLGLAAYAAAGAVLSLVAGRSVAAAVAVAATGGLLLAEWLRRPARSGVLAAFAARGLEPLEQRESSARRERAQRCWGITGLVCVTLGQVLGGIGELRGPQWLAAPGLSLMLAGFGALITLFGTTAWRFGDETPA